MLELHFTMHQPITERDAQMLIAMGDAMSAIFAEAKKPSATFAQVGTNMAQGYEQGVQQTSAVVSQAFEQLVHSPDEAAPHWPAAVNTHMLPPDAPITPPINAAPQPPVTPPSANVTPMPPAPPAAPFVPTTPPDYTHEQLGRAASAFIDKDPGNRGKLFALLQQFQVAGITQLATPDARTAFANAMRQLGVQV